MFLRFSRGSISVFPTRPAALECTPEESRVGRASGLGTHLE